ncbi:MAG TPA: hypothetical protein DDW52_25330 [Planctomycetaceae bacterium]|nr:hypothetical protein [Planctomycetaceae bacterium]
MAGLYRPDDSPYWYGEFISHDGSRKRKSTKTKNKRAADMVLRRWIADDQEIAQGKRSGADPRSITIHLNEFQASQALKNRVDTSGETTDESTRRWLDRLVEKYEWGRLGDISGDQIETYAIELRKSGHSNRSIQKMIAAVRTFCRWCVRKRRMELDPTQSVARPSPEEDRRLIRRMLLREEWDAIRSWLESGEALERNGQSAIERMLMYWLAIETGLRSNEIRQLTKSAVKSKPAPHVAAKGKTTKNAKPARQFLSDSLYENMRKHLASLSAGDLVFGVKDRREMARTLRQDAEDARLHSGNENEEFLAGQDAEGHVIDFHALRHTCGAWYVIAGLTLPEVQAIMRHSTIMLTIDSYGHLAPDAISGSRNKLGM